MQFFFEKKITLIFFVKQLSLKMLGKFEFSTYSLFFKAIERKVPKFKKTKELCKFEFSNHLRKQQNHLLLKLKHDLNR